MAHHHEHGGEHDHEHDKEGKTDEITLLPEVAARFGLEVESVSQRPLTGVVKVSGVVGLSTDGRAVVAAPTSGIVTVASGLEVGSEVGAGQLIASITSEGISGGDVNKIAKVEIEAAKREYERVSGLYADRLVTTAEYNNAKATYERAKAAFSVSAASGRAVSPVKGTISAFEAVTGQYVEAGTPIATIAKSDRLIVRGEVPVKAFAGVSGSTDARIVSPSDGKSVLISSLDGRRIDKNSAVTSSGGYVPVTYSIRNDNVFVPGQTVEIYILGDNAAERLAVPVTAISEQQGTFFVYEQLDEDCYRRLPITLGVSDGEYTEILDGLEGGENIVVKGVTAVRLAQTSGAVPEGHTHSH